MYASKPHGWLLGHCVGLNVCSCGFKRDGVFTPLLPFLGPDDEPNVDSLILYISVIKTRWEHDDVHSMWTVLRFLRCRRALVDIQGYRPRIVDF